jgi:ABC-type transporter Mla maintaining outer membrane lipid asymmetry ATPase subunit MlaF
VTAPVLELSQVSKDYRGLRPLRIASLAVAAAERVALLGFDRTTAEVFVNLVTGAALPDRGEVRLFGRPTAAITDSADWLAVVDRFGIVSPRAVLLEALSVVQNLSMPFTLDIEPPPPDIRTRAAALAVDVGLPEAALDRRVGDLDAAGLTRVRLARALALDPAIVVLEHPTAGVPPQAAIELGATVRDLAARRQAAVVVLTVDDEFAQASAGRVLTLDAASGRLRARGWFSHLRRS